MTFIINNNTDINSQKIVNINNIVLLLVRY